MTSDPTFNWAVDIVLNEEGGLIDHVRDPGGITNYGISLRFAQSVPDISVDGHPLLDVDGNGIVDANDIRKLTRDQAKQVYFTQFWKVCRCDQIASDGLALMLFDMAVNQGRGPAVTTLQHAVGALPDGKLGPKTIAAANSCDVKAAIVEFNARRTMRYATTNNFDTFGLGWMRRASRIMEHAVLIER